MVRVLLEALTFSRASENWSPIFTDTHGNPIVEMVLWFKGIFLVEGGR